MSTLEFTLYLHAIFFQVKWLKNYTNNVKSSVKFFTPNLPYDWLNEWNLPDIVDSRQIHLNKLSWVLTYKDNITSWRFNFFLSRLILQQRKFQTLLLYLFQTLTCKTQKKLVLIVWVLTAFLICSTEYGMSFGISQYC